MSYCITTTNTPEGVFVDTYAGFCRNLSYGWSFT